MTVAKSEVKQKPVSYSKAGSKVYVQLWLNEREYKTETESGEETRTETGYEYDFHEFCADASRIDLADVEQHPEKYTDYTEESWDDTERIRKLEEQQELTDAAVQELILTMMGE